MRMDHLPDWRRASHLMTAGAIMCVVLVLGAVSKGARADFIGQWSGEAVQKASSQCGFERAPFAIAVNDRSFTSTLVDATDEQRGFEGIIDLNGNISAWAPITVRNSDNRADELNANLRGRFVHNAFSGIIVVNREDVATNCHLVVRINAESKRDASLDLDKYAEPIRRKTDEDSAANSRAGQRWLGAMLSDNKLKCGFIATKISMIVTESTFITEFNDVLGAKTFDGSVDEDGTIFAYGRWAIGDTNNSVVNVVGLLEGSFDGKLFRGSLTGQQHNKAAGLSCDAMIALMRVPE
jgi:hypothetical protein